MNRRKITKFRTFFCVCMKTLNITMENFDLELLQRIFRSQFRQNATTAIIKYFSLMHMLEQIDGKIRIMQNETPVTAYQVEELSVLSAEANRLMNEFVEFCNANE